MRTAPDAAATAAKLRTNIGTSEPSPTQPRSNAAPCCSFPNTLTSSISAPGSNPQRGTYASPGRSTLLRFTIRLDSHREQIIDRVDSLRKRRIFVFERFTWLSRNQRFGRGTTFTLRGCSI
jgi:hypothetical protein